MTAEQQVVLVAAVADNGVIGDAGGMPWHHPKDFAHFKALTMGHTMVMGRATYDSIGRPLPGRETVVVTRDRAWSAEGVRVVHSFEEALQVAGELPGDVMVVGGAQIYALALPYADQQVITEIHDSPQGDTAYPDWDREQWVEKRRIAGDGLDWVWWDRAAAAR